MSIGSLLGSSVGAVAKSFTNPTSSSQGLGGLGGLLGTIGQLAKGGAKKPKKPKAQGPQDSFQASAKKSKHKERKLHVHHKAVKTAADALGMKPADLKKELDGGKSISDVVTEHGGSIDGIRNTLKAKLARKAGDAGDAMLDAMVDRVLNEGSTAPVGNQACTVSPSSLAPRIINP